MAAAYWRTRSPISWFCLRVSGSLALSLHSSNDAGESSQWHQKKWHYVIIITIIVIVITSSSPLLLFNNLH